MRNFLTETLAPKNGVSPLVYILLLVSIFIGLAFSPILPLDPAESILYGVTFLFSKGVWGTLLFISASIGLAGLFTRNEFLIFVGGMGGFLLWLFASISLLLAGQWYVLISVGILHLLFHGYLYLGATTGLIYRR